MRLIGKKQSLGTGLIRKFLVIVVSLSLVMAACGDDDAGTSETTTAGEAPDLTLAVVFYSGSIPFLLEIVDGINEKAAEYDITIEFAAANFDLAQEVDLMDNAVARGVDGIIMAPLDREALIPPTRRASEAGVPVITIGDELAEEGEPFVLSFVGQIYKDMAIAKAEWLVSQMGTEGTILTVHGPRGLDFIESQREGYEEVFAQYPGITVVEGNYGNISSEVGLETLENLLSANPEPDAIWFDNDDLALGGLKAMRERGVDFDSVVTVSSDGTLPALDAIRAGELGYTAGSRPNLLGRAAVEAFYQFLVNGVTPDHSILIPILEITIDNVDDLGPTDVIDPGN
jgi:ABC-type sugar transport system substrate-binding protein